MWCGLDARRRDRRCVLRPIDGCACLSMFGVDRNRRMLGSASAGWCFVWSPWGPASRWALVVLLCLLVRVRWHHGATDATANPPRRRTLASNTHAFCTKPLGPLVGIERRAARLQGSASSIEGALFNAWRHPGVIDPSLFFTQTRRGRGERKACRSTRAGLLGGKVESRSCACCKSMHASIEWAWISPGRGPDPIRNPRRSMRAFNFWLWVECQIRAPAVASMHRSQAMEGVRTPSSGPASKSNGLGPCIG